MMIEPLRFVGWLFFVLSIPVIKLAYNRLTDQEEKESPDLNVIFTSQLAGRAGVFFFLAGIILIVNGGTLQ